MTEDPPPEPRDDDAFEGARLMDAVQELAHLQRTRLEPRLAALSLAWGHDAVLRALWEHGPQRQVELARRLRMARSAMTRTLQRMEGDGWVLRTTHPRDRRATLVATTAQADRVRPALENVWTEALALCQDVAPGLFRPPDPPPCSCARGRAHR